MSVVVLFAIVLLIAFSDGDSRKIGEMVGRLIVCLIFPAMMAWIVWRFSGRKEKGGKLTFNVVLTLFLLGQIGQIGREGRNAQRLKNLYGHKENFKREMLSTEDPEKRRAAFERYSNSVIDEFKGMSETSSGPEKKFFDAMSGFVEHSKSVGQRWDSAVEAVQSSRILDYSLLDNDEEFDYQRAVLEDYIEIAKARHEFLANLAPNLRKRLGALLEEENEFAQGAMNGALKQQRFQKPIIEPLLQAHIGYGENMIQLLNLLQKHQDEWKFINDELVIHNDDVLDQCVAMVDSLTENEATIMALTQKLAVGK